MLDAMLSSSKRRLSRHRPSQLRAIRTYLVGILILTLVLFSVSLISLVQQQMQVRQLSISTLHADGARIAREMEQRIELRSSECLKAVQVRLSSLPVGNDLPPGAARALRAALDEVKRAHPIAQYFFVWRDGSVVYPSLSEPPGAIPGSFSQSRNGQSGLGDQQRLARAVRDRLNVTQAARTGTGVFQRLVLGESSFQVYFAYLPGTPPQKTLAGFSLSEAALQGLILSDSVEEVIGAGETRTYLAEPPGRSLKEHQEGDLLIPFDQNMLAGWNLRIPASEALGIEAAANRELAFMGMSAGMFLCILGLGLYFLNRVTRDLQRFQLQSDFVSSVSHELKTPLSLIRLYSETLADGEEDYSPEEKRSYIRIIARESERLTRLIDNILDFSKIELGLKHIEMKEGDLAAAVRQTVDDYSEYLALRGFAVKVGLQPYLPPVRFNAEQVSQVVLNLLDNARKYSDKSRLIRVHMWREDGHVVLEVQDYGYGIPAEERAKIFEPFYRAARGSEKGGCGLGLYLVRNVIESHGGRIEVFSDVGKGSRFRLYFPIDAAAQESLGEAERLDRERSLIGTN